MNSRKRREGHERESDRDTERDREREIKRKREGILTERARRRVVLWEQMWRVCAYGCASACLPLRVTLHHKTKLLTATHAGLVPGSQWLPVDVGSRSAIAGVISASSLTILSLSLLFIQVVIAAATATTNAKTIATATTTPAAATVVLTTTKSNNNYYH